MFTVSQYDSYSYLFDQPTFISLDPAAKPNSNIAVKGIRIGLNGNIPQVGQAYIPLNTTVTAANYKSTGRGAVAHRHGDRPAERAATDPFFLTFDQLGSHTHVVVEPTPTPPGSTPGPIVADIGVRTFAQVNSTLSQLTACRPRIRRSTRHIWPCSSSCRRIRRSRASLRRIRSGSLSSRFSIATSGQSPRLQTQLYGTTLAASQFATPGGINTVTSALANRVLGNSPNNQPAAATVTGELDHPDRETLRHQFVQYDGGDKRGSRGGLRHGARQRRHVDQLRRRIEEVFI